MGDYVFTLKLETDDVRAAQVRVFIDDELAEDLSSERELDLTREGGDVWVGRFSTRGDAFIYRIGMCGAVGSKWAFSFRQAQEPDAELLFDSDRLSDPKEWLLGTCEASEPSLAGPRLAAVFNAVS